MRTVELNAPIGSIDLAAEGHVIWACGQCAPWHLEVLRDPETDEVFAREWHARRLSRSRTVARRRGAPRAREA
jgi:hypothetical protein